MDMLTLTDHEIAEYQRAATALYRTLYTTKGHLLSAVAAKRTAADPETLAQFDRAGVVYRSWLTAGQDNRGQR